MWSLSQAGACASDPALVKLLSQMVKTTCHLFDSQRFVHLIYYYAAVLKVLPSGSSAVETSFGGGSSDTLAHLANVARCNRQHFSSKELANILCTYGDWIDSNRASLA